MEWRVGVLRSGAENVAWTERGEAADWAGARLAAIEELQRLAGREGRQEYRVVIDGQAGIVVPGLEPDGAVALVDLDRVIPVERYSS
ncbi:hypothetical protein [Pseudonocardia phyllosphaerae]|uniref:hypothetical protein n=1 Tax=Pseudonocardia phyllosphaerae TaxID=3390502 RepID=UPI003978769F